jgi:hypothetical protein
MPSTDIVNYNTNRNVKPFLYALRLASAQGEGTLVARPFCTKSIHLIGSSGPRASRMDKSWLVGCAETRQRSLLSGPVTMASGLT